MAASENAVVGVDLKLQHGGTLIGTQTGGSLSISPDLGEILLKNDASGSPTDFKGRLSGEQSWDVSHEGLLLNGSEEYHIANGNAKLELEVDTTDDSTDNPSYVEIPRLESIDFTLAQEIAETGGLDRALWRYLRPAEREFTVDVSGSYVDPASDLGAVYDGLMTARDNGTNVPARLTVMGKTFEGDVAIGDTSIDGQTGGEDATIEVSMASDGPLTTGGSAFGTGIESIFTAWENQNLVDVGMLHYTDGSPTTGATKFTGSGYLTEVAIGITDGEEITCSTSLAGDGALSRGTIS